LPDTRSIRPQCNARATTSPFDLDALQRGVHSLGRDIQISAGRTQVRVIEERLNEVRRHAVLQDTRSRLAPQIVEVNIDRSELLSTLRR